MGGGDMSKRARMRMMKKLVIICYATLICMFAAAYVAYWYGIDMGTWLMLGCGSFDLALFYNAWIKLSENKNGTGEDKPDDVKTSSKKTATRKVNG